jgi:hypothetical protein
MKTLREVLDELISMFLADARMTVTTLLLVAVVGGLAATGYLPQIVSGLLLLVGCIAILLAAVMRGARLRRPS